VIIHIGGDSESYRQDGERAYVVSIDYQEKEQPKKYGVHEELDRLPPGKRTVDTK